MSLLAYKDIDQFEYRELINRENSIKLLFEFNKVINEQTPKETLSKTPQNDLFAQKNEERQRSPSLLENNRVTLQVNRYEPLLFKEFREFYFKQGFFRDEGNQLIRKIVSRSSGI